MMKGTSSMESILRRFAEMCKSDRSMMVFKDYVSSNAQAIGEGHVETKLRVYKLPDGLKWPIFLTLKQKAVKCANLYFCRMTPADITRRELTLQLLMEGQSPIWKGVQGIGKSADMNYILMELFAHLGEEGWPAVVAFRFDGKIAEFRYDSSRSRIRFSWHQGSITDILSYTEGVKDMGQSAALVVELAEMESEPVSCLPMTIAITSGNANNILRTLNDMNVATNILIPPPTLEEIQLMVQAELDLNHSSLFPALSIDQVNAEVKRRVDIVGPITRYVIASEPFFNFRKKEFESNAAYINFSDQLTDLGFGSVPDGIEPCVAPFLKYGVENPQLSYYKDVVSLETKNMLSPTELKTSSHEFKFLSDYVALKVAKVVMDNDRDIHMLKIFGLDYQLAGVVIKYIVLDASMRPKVSSEFWDMSHWEWHMDPGYQSLLDTTTVITSTPIPTIPPCFREITYSGVFLNKPAKELEAGVLYRSISPNMAVGEFLTVDHATKTVFMFQATLSDIQERPFRASAIERVMAGLNMISTADRESAKYSLHLLCFTDWSMKERHGSKIIDDLSQESTLNFSLIKSNVIRACICPEREKYDLQDAKNPPISDQNQRLTDPRISWRAGYPQAIYSQSTQRSQEIDSQTTRGAKVTKKASLKKKSSR